MNVGSPNKGRLLKTKTIINDNNKHHDADDNSFSKSTNEINSPNKQNSLQNNYRKKYIFKKEVDIVDVESYKIYNIDIETEKHTAKCANCNSKCVIY
jgi:hypothetical protein